MKVVLNYDTSTGQLINPVDGIIVHTCTGMKFKKVKKPKANKATLKLAGLGYSAEDMIKMKSTGLL